MASIDAETLENLLNMPEGSTLDFKGEQYRLDGANDDEKGEFVKDVLSFANAWKTADAHILVGVREDPGQRATVVGVAQHPDDASLQQLVNMKTNVPVDFAYVPTTIDGKSVGVVAISRLQPRPIFLKKKFGRLEENLVYLRRGSSTAIARPDEIARMGAAEAALNLRPTVSVQLGDPTSQKVHGNVATVCSQVLTKAPERQDPLSLLDKSMARFDPSEMLRGFDRPSRRQLDEHEQRTALLNCLAFLVNNPGRVLIEDLRIVATIPKQSELVLMHTFPRTPGRMGDFFIPRPSTTPTEVEERGETWELTAHVGKVQPNATVWSDAFWVGSSIGMEVPLRAKVYADNIVEKTEVDLRIVINVEHGFLKGVYDDVY